MSDQENIQETNQPTEQEIIKANASELSEEKIKEIVSSAVSAAQASQPAQLSESQIAEILEKQRLDIAKSIAGTKEDENRQNPIHQAFINDPSAFLERFAQTVEKRIASKQSIETEKKLQFDDAYLKTLSNRPDIMNSKHAQKVFLNFYGETSEDKNEEERFKAALDSYDVFLEEQNAGDAKVRVDRARGLSLSSSKGEESKPQRKSEADILLDEQREQKARFLASRGRA